MTEPTFGGREEKRSWGENDEDSTAVMRTDKEDAPIEASGSQDVRTGSSASAVSQRRLKGIKNVKGKERRKYEDEKLIVRFMEIRKLFETNEQIDRINKGQDK